MNDIMEIIASLGCLGVSCLVRSAIFIAGCAIVLWILGVI